MNSASEIGYVVGLIIGGLLAISIFKTQLLTLFGILLTPLYLVMANMRIKSLFNDLGMDTNDVLTKLKDSGIARHEVLEMLNMSIFDKEKTSQNFSKEQVEAVIAELLNKIGTIRRHVEDELKETTLDNLISAVAKDDNFRRSAEDLYLKSRYRVIIEDWRKKRTRQLKDIVVQGGKINSTTKPARDSEIINLYKSTDEDIEIPNDIGSLTVNDFEYMMDTLKIYHKEYQYWTFAKIENILKKIKKGKKIEKLRVINKVINGAKNIAILAWLIVLLLIVRACVS